MVQLIIVRLGGHMILYYEWREMLRGRKADSHSCEKSIQDLPRRGKQGAGAKRCGF